MQADQLADGWVDLGGGVTSCDSRSFTRDMERKFEDFQTLYRKASGGKTAEVLAAVDQDRSLATRANTFEKTLLMAACQVPDDNPQLARGLLERGANLHARDLTGNDALTFASEYGKVAIYAFLEEWKRDSDSKTHTGKID